MTVHIILLAAVIGFAAVLYKLLPVSRKTNLIYITGSMFMVFLVEALRAETVGRDTYVYKISFAWLTEHPEFDWRTSAWEKFYILLGVGVSKLTKNPQIFLAIVSGIIMFGFGLFIYKTMDHRNAAFWPVFFFLTSTQYLNSMNLLRQYLAMAFTLQIYWVLRDGKGWKKYVLSAALLFTGVMFHTFALVCVIFAVPFLLRKITRKTILITGIAGAALFALAGKLLLLFLKLFPQYAKYAGTRYFAGSGGLGIYYLANVFFRIGLIVLAFLLAADEEKNQEVWRLSVFTVISTVLILMQTQFSMTARISYFFDMFVFMLVPEILGRIPKKQKQAGLLLILFGLFCFAATIDSTERACIPYYFFWQQP